MSWTKEQLVRQAYEEIGYASYIYDLLPEQLQSGLRKLDAMLGQWALKGILIGFPMPDSPDTSNINDDSGIPDGAWEAVYTNLAIRIGPPVGKQIPQETKQIAKDGYDTLLIIAAQPYPMQFPNTLPIGQGTKPWRRTDWPYVRPPVNRLNVTQGNYLEKVVTGNPDYRPPDGSLT